MINRYNINGKEYLIDESDAPKFIGISGCPECGGRGIIKEHHGSYYYEEFRCEICDEKHEQKLLEFRLEYIKDLES